MTRTVPSAVHSLPVRLLDPAAVLPSRAHADDAGLDLSSVEQVVLNPGERALVRTGVAVAIPGGHAGFVHPRSGLSVKHGISIVNAPGVVDAGYRGEVMVNLINLGAKKFVVEPGDRIAQLVVQQVVMCTAVAVETLGDSERGSGGHGSSGA